MHGRRSSGSALSAQAQNLVLDPLEGGRHIGFRLGEEELALELRGESTTEDVSNRSSGVMIAASTMLVPLSSRSRVEITRIGLDFISAGLVHPVCHTTINCKLRGLRTDLYAFGPEVPVTARRSPVSICALTKEP